MSLTNFKTSLTGSFRPKFAESAFVFEIESTLTSRPLVLFFMVDASHSMRFYIDEEKTIQRQTIVQSVVQMGLNSSAIIQNGDYVNLATFSTDINNLLETTFIEVNEGSRNNLDTIVGSTLKSDGGKTNYGKAFEFLLSKFEEVKSELPSDSPLLTGPMLVWFLTDGRPWPDDIEGNTLEDIFNYANKIGESGNELWIIGISTDANQEFLGRIAYASQEGASKYQKSLQDVPKEFIFEQLAMKQTLWVDLDFSSQERLIHGLVNAIEAARLNLGLVPEVELAFQSDLGLPLEFSSGISNLQIHGDQTIITLKRPTSLKIGQKLSLAFSLNSSNPILENTKLISIKTKLHRGSEIVEEKIENIELPLKSILKEDTKTFNIKGAESVRTDLAQVRSQLISYTEQLNDLIVTLEAVGLQNREKEVTEYANKLDRIQKLFEQRKGIATRLQNQ